MSFLVVHRMPRKVRVEHLIEGEVNRIDVGTRIHYEVYGGDHARVFRTLKNAMKCAAEYNSYGDEERHVRPMPGFVVKFDPSLLPIVAPQSEEDTPLFDIAHQRAADNKKRELREFSIDSDDLDEQYALAERQMLLWERRVQDLRERLDIARGSKSARG